MTMRHFSALQNRVFNHTSPIGWRTLQRACACGQHTGGGECESCKKKRLKLQRSAIKQDVPNAAPPIVHEVLRSPGQPLDDDIRRLMESRFGQDFNHVRVHTDAKATESARTMEARAYTIGQDIAFGAGWYAPHTSMGQNLLIHEITHVVQQRSAPVLPGASIAVGPSDDAYEQEADRTAGQLSTSSSARVSSHMAGPVSLRRQPNPRAAVFQSGGGNQALRENVPVEKWSEELERQYRQRGDTERANAIRDCRTQGGAACARLLTQSEVERYSTSGSLRDIAQIQRELRSFGFIILEDPLAVCIGGCHLPARTSSTRLGPGDFPFLRPPSQNLLREWSQERTPEQYAPNERLNFFHGTRWSIARTIPGNVRPLGGGDYAAGFYTHQDEDNNKALRRAKKWGMRIAREAKEKYAGVVKFSVPQRDYLNLMSRSSRVFNFTRTDQPDYAERQREWLRFVTSYGREARPVYDPQRAVWVHPRREPQPHLPYNIIRGPFYGPIPGTPGPEPRPEAFRPFSEGRRLPQQVVWANDGIALLNSSRTSTDLQQYDANTGERKDPPDDRVTAPAAVPTSLATDIRVPEDLTP